MQIATDNSFDIRQWIQKCPPGLQPYLESYLENVAENSKNLRQFLDNIIQLILACERALQQAAGQDQSYLHQRLVKLYQLVSFLIDQPVVTLNDIKIIKARRRIDESYLPNHLPGDTPPEYLPLEFYQELDEQDGPYQALVHSLDTKASKLGHREDYFTRKLSRMELRIRDVIDPLQEQKPYEQILDEQEQRYRKYKQLLEGEYKESKKRLEANKTNLKILNNNLMGTSILDKGSPKSPSELKKERHGLLLKMEENLRKCHRQERMVKLLEDLVNYRLLPLEFNYFKIEALPKAVLPHISTHLPTWESLDDFFNRVEKCFADISNLDGDFTKTLTSIVTRWRIQRESVGSHQSKSACEVMQSSLGELLHKIRQREKIISIEDGDTELELLFVLKALRKKLKAVVNNINPMLLAYYQAFYHKKQDLFTGPRNTEHKFTDYLTPDKREKLRVHIYQGKLYTLSFAGGQIQYQPFNTGPHKSHKKKGWVCFVMNANGEIFAASHGPRKSPHIIFHSSFMGGAPVIFAGEMQVDEDGTILAVSDYSGHYGPCFHNLELFAQHLSSRCVDLSRCTFYCVNGPKIDAELNKIKKLNVDDRTKDILEHKVLISSKKLKFSTQYHLQDGKLVPVPYWKKAFVIGSLVALTMLGIALLTVAAVVSHGTLVPVVTPVLAKLTMATGATIANLITFGTPALMTAFPLLIGSFHLAGGLNGIKKLASRFNSFFITKEPISQPPETFTVRLPPGGYDTKAIMNLTLPSGPAPVQAKPGVALRPLPGTNDSLSGASDPIPKNKVVRDTLFSRNGFSDPLYKGRWQRTSQSRTCMDEQNSQLNQMVSPQPQST